MRSVLAFAIVLAVALASPTAKAAAPDQAKPDQVQPAKPDQAKPDQVKHVKPDQAKPDQVKQAQPDQVKVKASHISHVHLKHVAWRAKG